MTPIGLDSGPEVDVIVELVEPPLLSPRRRSRDRVAAARTIDALVERLNSDLTRIEERPGRAPRANAVEERMVKRAYALTFAGASARLRRDSVAAVRALPYVKAVHADRDLQAHTAQSVPHIGAPAAWKTYAVRGRGVVIAIIDTGIDYRHRSLGNGFGPGHKVIGGYDFVNDDADPKDDSGHGTHVAGIAAGNLAPVVGVAPDASLLAYKVLNENGRGKTSAIIAAVERAMDPDANGDVSDRADVINMSLGGPAAYDDPLIAAAERASAAGSVVVLSAGNDYYPGGIGTPAAAPSAITVAATKLDDTRAFFSSRGPVGGSWLTKPEVAAPGYDISSARLGTGTVMASGTSMAAPHVAGVAALILERYPDWTPDAVKAAIVSTAKPAFFADLPGGSRTVLGAGAGRVDTPAALAATILPSPATVSFGLLDKYGTAYKATRTFRLTNRGNESETITINVPALPKGVTLSVEPASIAIPRGGSAEITLTLELAPAAVPNEDDVSVAGLIELSGARSLWLPWQVVNGDTAVANFEGTEDVSVAVISRDHRPILWPNGPRSIGAFIPREFDTIAYYHAAEGGMRRLVIREDEPIKGYTPITIAPQDAKFRVEFAGSDERGVPFAELTAAGGPATSFLTQHLFIRGNMLEMPDVSPDTSGERELWVSPVKAAVLRGIEVLSTANARYATMYRVLRGLQRDAKLEIHPGDWASQTVEHRCNTDECTTWLSAGAGSFALHRWYDPKIGEGTWRIFLTARVAEEWDFRASLIVQEEGFEPQDGSNPFNYVSPPFRNEGGRISVAPFGHRSVADYFPPYPYKPLVLGDTIPVLRTGLGARKIVFDPAGAALGGSLADKVRQLNPSFYWDETNEPAPVRPALVKNTFFPGDAIGALRLELSLDFDIAGTPARLSQITRWDSRERIVSSPTLTMLRVEDAAGDLTHTLPMHSRARLTFAARDTALDQQGFIYHRNLLPSGVTVWWRPHGTTDWREVPATHIGSDYQYQAIMPGSPGTVMTVDLPGATALAGAVDVKFRVANPWKASTEVVYEPLLLVTPAAPKRRAVR